MLINTKTKYFNIFSNKKLFHCCCCGCCSLTPIIMNPHHLPSMWKEGDLEYFNIDDAVQNNVAWEDSIINFLDNLCCGEFVFI